MLLIDQNLSHRLVQRLADVFPGAVHVRTVGLDRADDREVWQFAQNASLGILAKDQDFDDLATRQGAPPVVVRITIGNASTAETEDVLRTHAPAIRAFLAQTTESILTVP